MKLIMRSEFDNLRINDNHFMKLIIAVENKLLKYLIMMVY